MSESKLRRELRKKLSLEQIDIFQNIAIYYDFHGVTFRESDEERQIVKKYITEMISKKINCPAQITKWGESNNGHFAHYFKRL